ncbi:uncharacterized LOC128092251 homolog isoform X1 [Pan troglodytes]
MARSGRWQLRFVSSSDRMKTNTEMVCLRNFKRCRPPD